MSEEYKKLQNVIVDRTTQVALGKQKGFYLVGRPGTGKTETVRQTVQRLGIACTWTTGTVKPAGFVELVLANLDKLLVLDDVPTMFKNKDMQPILMSLMSTPPVLNYTKFKERIYEPFSGGIIAISNLGLGDDPLARAIASRMVTFDFDPNDQAMIGFMGEIAKAGFKELSPKQGKEVLDFLKKIWGKECRPDLRHFVQAAADYHSQISGIIATSWQDLTRINMKTIGMTVTIGHQHTDRAGRIAFESSQAREIIREFPYSDQRAERRAEWSSRVSGSSEKSLYRRLGELKLKATPRPKDDFVEADFDDDDLDA